MLTIWKLFVVMDLAVMATQFITKELQTRLCSYAQNGFFQNFLNPINFDLKIHFKMVLEWSEHSFMVKNTKNHTKDHSFAFPHKGLLCLLQYHS